MLFEGHVVRCVGRRVIEAKEVHVGEMNRSRREYQKVKVYTSHCVEKWY